MSTQDERVLQLLHAACKKAGSQSAWAREHGVRQQYVSLVLNGSRRAGPQILAALGLARVSRITKKARADADGGA
jgi:hypothetical protein